MRRTYIRGFFACAMLAVVVFMMIPTRIHADDALENKISKIVASIPEAYQSDAMKALYLHDYVVDHVVYGQSANDQTAYGALIEGKAVCAGYTDAYQKLLTAAGIESTFISGLADNGSGAPQAHAWIMVKLEGKCYFTDVTWDDPFVNGVQEKRHNYFNLSLEQMSVDHFPYDRYADVLPDSCNHTDLDYYSLCAAKGAGVGIFDDDTTAAEAAKYFAQVSNGEFTCDFRFDGTNLDAWIDDNWEDIAYALGLPHHHEGVNSNWVLVDYTGVVVNIFQQEARELYALERLWGDGTKLDISNLIVKED